MKYDPEVMKLAIDEYEAQLQSEPEIAPNVKEIAAKYGLVHSTLYRRVRKGVSAPRRAHPSQQALTPQEEEALVEYINSTCRQGHPINPSDAVEIANYLRGNRLLLDGVPTKELPPLGKNWTAGFWKRHEQVRSSFSRVVDSARYKSASRAKLEPYYDEVSALMARNEYLPCNIYNMDETGHAMGTTQSSRVLTIVEPRTNGPRRVAKAAKTGGEKGETVTTLECVSASGRVLPYLVIFKGQKGYNLPWMPQGVDLEGWAFTATPSGWTNDEVGFLWLETVFQPATKPADANTRRLLIMDGHSSHTKGPVIGFCILNKIDLVILPAHTSHVTQPLDVGIFAPLKAAMARETDRRARLKKGKVSKREWTAWLAAARATAMNERNIRVGWRKTGLHPFSPDYFFSQLDRPPTPPPRSTPLSRTPLASISSENLEFLEQHSQNMNTPVKERFHILTEVVEGLKTHTVMVEKQLKELGDAMNPPTKRRAGMTVENVGTHVFSSFDVLRRAQEAERATKSRKSNSGAGEGSAGSGGRPVHALVVAGPSTQ
ncbi:hypothetical protein P7C73_g7, partial [Tremellales sp. Uapishka_1]